MSWPLSQDYNEVIQGPATSFRDAELRAAEPVVNALGIPQPRTGNFADVYEVRSARGHWAVKCFTREVPGLRERYAAISRHLHDAKLPFTVDFTFLEEGILVRGRWYPVLKMQWVEGLTLNDFVRQYADKPPMLNGLLQIWVRMAARLREAGMAHADLQHGNVILVPGSTANSLAVKLVDYDGMWVPALANKKSGEVGHPNFQHPQRLKEGTYSGEVDRFPLLLVATALDCLKVGGKAVWDKYDSSDNLLFRESDLQSPNRSPLFYELLKLADERAARLVRQTLDALKGRLEAVPLLAEVLPELQGAPASRQATKQSTVVKEAAQPAAAGQAGPGVGAASGPSDLDFDREGKPPARPRRKAVTRRWLRAVTTAGVAALVVVGGILAFRGADESKDSRANSTHNRISKPPDTTKAGGSGGKPDQGKKQQAADKNWIEKVRAFAAAEQVKAVAAKLKERNPGFDGLVTPSIENEEVKGLEIATDHVTNLSPLRALPALKSLWCTGSAFGKGKLADLSPLEGMSLTTLDCSWNSPLSDLSPLKGMPLTFLAFSGSQVKDLSPLQDMPLETLRCGGTEVSDLSPLRGMPLVNLWCEGLRVTDLSPLRGMPLKVLVCDFRPERDTEVVRSIKTLEEINHKPVEQFWKEVASTTKPGGSPTPQKTVTVDVSDGVMMEFVLVPKGKFMMGSPPDEKDRNLFWRGDAEKLHAVDISRPFYLAKYPVTQEQYQALLKDNPSHFQGGKGGADKVKGLDTKQFPAESVSWSNAQVFCNKMSENDKQGRKFRLPTEAEWEYACRAGKQTAFFFGDDFENLGDYAWIRGNSGGRTHQVGEKNKPNAWGLHDMHGNVWQWCEGDAEARRFFRGGSWFDSAGGCRAACRQCRPASAQGPNIGFRVAFSVDEDKSTTTPPVILPENASVADLRKALKNEDPMVQERAVGLLAKLGPKAEPAMSDLADTVTDAKNPTKVRSIAALAIGNIGAGAKPVVPALAKALKKSEPLEVRQSAAEALSKIQYPANEAAIPALLDTVENDPEPKVRQRCVWSLFGMTPDKARACGADKTLAKLLDEPDGRLTLVRYDAARALAFQLGPDAPDQTVDVLLHMLRNKAIKVFSGTDVKVNGPGKGPRDSNVRVNRTASGDARHMAAQALARLGQKAARNPAAIKALKEAVKDSDSKLSGAARAALNRLKINAEDTPTHRKEPPVRDPRPS